MLKDNNLNNICLEKPVLAEYDALVVKREKTMIDLLHIKEKLISLRRKVMARRKQK